MMNPFFDPFWNLDQVRAWACSRDPEVVRFAAEETQGRPAHNSHTIAVRAEHAALKSQQTGRDVNLELWRASGWPIPENHNEPITEDPIPNGWGVPAFHVLNDASLEVQFPRCQSTDAFLDAYGCAGEVERDVLHRLFLEFRREDEVPWLGEPAFTSLSPKLRQVCADYLNRKAVHGPWRLVRHADFPIEDYLLHLFLTERLSAEANPPDHPNGRALTKADWRGLEIAAGGDMQRLSIWRIGFVSKSGGGDFENARVEREAVLREFPEEPPLAQSLSIPATDDAARTVIRQVLADSGGFIGQEKGAEIVRAKIPSFPKKRAMQLVKELTGNEKPGPKGPRRNRAANRAG